MNETTAEGGNEEEIGMSTDPAPSARARYANTSSQGESALLSGDPTKRHAWLDDMARAEREVHAADHGPSWAAILADSTSQLAWADEITASILAHRDAPLASACACGGSIHDGCRP